MTDSGFDRASECESPLNIVTGAFGFSGKYIAECLLRNGQRVRTLTNRSGESSSLREQIEVAPLYFSSFDEMVRNMSGAKVLYNTYWVRFDRGNVSYETAIDNTRLLLRAAEKAGIERIVHLSVTNPSRSSPLPYYRGKALVEEEIQSSQLSYAILRPTLVFGAGDILINNIAWLLHRFPIFAIPGKGDYSVQPVFAEDLAALAIEYGRNRENCVIDTVGPETYTYDDFVRMIADAIGSRSRIVHLPVPWVALASKFLGWGVNDVLLTKEEIAGLMTNLLVSKQPPNGKTSFRAWLQEHAQTLGRTYASELDRHFR